MTEELWAPIPDWPYYQASSAGLIRSLPRWVHRGEYNVLRRGYILSPNPGTTDRLKVTLHDSGKKCPKAVHVLVCSAFHGPAPEGKPWALHRNGNHRDNRPENLYWGSPKENATDSLRHGTNFQANKTHCVKGHEFTPENTYWRPDGGGRQCRMCISERSKRYAEERRVGQTLDRMRGSENA